VAEGTPGWQPPVLTGLLSQVQAMWLFLWRASLCYPVLKAPPAHRWRDTGEGGGTKDSVILPR
jgi:hypothetical protein